MIVALLACSVPERPPDIVLMTWDTTRADALGCYGASPSPTPVLDGLAESGWVAEEALATAPFTQPSHTSLLTGRWPTRTGVLRNGGERLAPDTTTLASTLADAGYATAAFVSAVVLDRSFGLDQGFATYDDGPYATTTIAIPRRAGGATTDHAISWLLDQGADRPVFLWVHLYDAHLPYSARAYASGGDPYSTEIRGMDEQLGHLLDAFRVLRRDRRLVVAVTADHGEARGEHDEATHGWFAYRSTLRVPLVVSGVPALRGREPGPVSLTDVAPTLAGLGGATLPDADGIRLPAQDHPPVFAGSWGPWYALGYSPIWVVQDARWRRVRAPRPELFDWRGDPAEGAPVADPIVAEALDGLLDAWIADSGPDTVPARDAVLNARLLALGYAAEPSVGAVPRAPDALRDPKDDARANDEIFAAVIEARRRPPEEGVPLLQAALAERPDSAALRDMLARGFVALGEVGRAVATLAPSAPDTHVRVAKHALELGRLDVVFELLPLAATSDPEGGAVLAEALRRAERAAEARQVAERSLRGGEDPDGVLALLVAATWVDEGDARQAIPALAAVLASHPRNPDVRPLLARSLLDVDAPAGAAQLLDEQAAIFGTTDEIEALRTAAAD